MATARPTVALIHASEGSIAPAEAAFTDEFPQADLWHLMDDRLVSDAEKAGGLTDALRDRMSKLIQYAVDGGADAVQLSCSMYGPVAVDAAAAQPVIVLASDQAMFEQVARAQPERVGILASLASAAADTTQRLGESLTQADVDAELEPRVVAGSADAVRRGDTARLTGLLVAAAAELADHVDLIVLAQYSLAPTLPVLSAAVSVPVLSPPHLAASTLARTLADTAGGPPVSVLLGCIADDFTGGTDVAAALRRSGLSVALLFGVPAADDEVLEADAVVIALKSRTIPASEAIALSLAALAWLQERAVQHVYFKYCSTFDSTDEGNIGPVIDALLAALGETVTVICPASPEHGRTMYRGHLFVEDQLLSESSMRHHPLTPMTDPNIARVLQRQTDGLVERLTFLSIRAGSDEVAARLKDMSAREVRHVVTDAIAREDLLAIASGGSSLRLLTGGAGLAGALGEVLAGQPDHSESPARTLPSGSAVALAGSCSAATLAQVAAAAAAMPSYRLDPAATPDPDQLLEKALTWVQENLPSNGRVLVYSSAGPAERERARAAMGPETAEILERTLGRVAQAAVAQGARRIVVAGGETSGAVVQALGVSGVIVDREADAGVPWCLTKGEQPLALLLKSGNFGSEDLLLRATDQALS